MKVLFDQGAPHPLRRHLTGHEVQAAAELGWSRLRNGELIRRAEQLGFDVLVTTDQNLRYQQNLAGRRLAVVVLLSTSWPRMRPQVARIQQAVDGATPGAYVEVPI